MSWVAADYADHVRWCDEDGTEPLPFDLWLAAQTPEYRRIHEVAS